MEETGGSGVWHLGVDQSATVTKAQAADRDKGLQPVRTLTHFGGGLRTNSIPFSMFPFKPAVQGSRSFFS